jgi:hypothetical protein
MGLVYHKAVGLRNSWNPVKQLKRKKVKIGIIVHHLSKRIIDIMMD